MKTVILVLALFVAAAAPARAEIKIQFPTAGERTAADVASWVTVGAAVYFDLKGGFDKCQAGHSVMDCNYRVLVTGAARVGVTYGAVLLVKKLVHRARPCAPNCGIDDPNTSFYSAHTALAFSTLGGSRLAISLPLAIGTGGLRVGAGKHYISDVLVGAAVGALTSRIR